MFKKIIASVKNRLNNYVRRRNLSETYVNDSGKIIESEPEFDFVDLVDLIRAAADLLTEINKLDKNKNA